MSLRSTRSQLAARSGGPPFTRTQMFNVSEGENLLSGSGPGMVTGVVSPVPGHADFSRRRGEVEEHGLGDAQRGRVARVIRDRHREVLPPLPVSWQHLVGEGEQIPSGHARVIACPPRLAVTVAAFTPLPFSTIVSPR